MGAVIFEKLINDIKAKIPFGKKGSEEELDDNEDSSNDNEDATDPRAVASDKTGATDISDLDEDNDVANKPQTLVDKIKAKLGPKKKAVDDDEETGEAKKPEKKKINPIVLAVVVSVGIYLFLDEEPEEVAQPKPIKKIEKVAKPEEPKKETPEVAEKPADTSTDKPSEEAPEAATEEPDSADSATTEPAIEEPASEEPVITEEPAVVEEPAPEEPVITEEPAEEPKIETPKEVAPVSVDSVDGQVTETDESMTDKILEDLENQVKKDQPKEAKKEYVNPPDYEYKGRGLVYNCSGKHWACVDGPSYKICEDNFSSTTFQKKSIECYPFNVYESKQGCELMQNRVVSSNAKTGFCKGN